MPNLCLLLFCSLHAALVFFWSSSVSCFFFLIVSTLNVGFYEMCCEAIGFDGFLGPSARQSSKIQQLVAGGFGLDLDMYVCMYVCIYIYMHFHIHICIHVYEQR